VPGCAGKCAGKSTPELERALQMQGAQIKRCYDGTLKADRTLGGKMRIAIRIGDSGGVCSSEIVESEMPATMNDCARQVLGVRAYPAPAGGCVDVMVPLNFQTADGGALPAEAGAGRMASGGANADAMAPGQCFSSGDVQAVIGAHQLELRHACWEVNPTPLQTVTVDVRLVIDTDGTPQAVTTSGDEPSVASCVESQVRGWRFPAMGCRQKTGFGFKFVRPLK
jgi:hypothetical protein